MVTKVNPIFDAAQARAFIGKTHSEFVVAVGVDASGATDPGDAIDAMIKTLEQRCTLVMMSDVDATGFTIFVEGEFPTDDYNDDGTPVTFAALLQADIVALGATVGTPALDLTGATVTAGTVYKADQV